MRERPQAGHIHAGHGDAGQSAESERREQAVAQRHAEAGQRAKGARREIELPGGPAIGQADQRDDGEHIARRDNSGEPTGLRVGQRPSLDELRQQRRNDRKSRQAEDFGAAYSSNTRRRRSSPGRASGDRRAKTHSHRGNNVWMSETGGGLLWALPEDRRDAVRRRCPAIARNKPLMARTWFSIFWLRSSELVRAASTSAIRSARATSTVIVSLGLASGARRCAHSAHAASSDRTKDRGRIPRRARFREIRSTPRAVQVSARV